jgi:hypothetical protein
MIGVMASPFRYDKKGRKRLRRQAKSEVKAADAFQAEGTKPEAVAVLRRLANYNTRMSLARRRKDNSKHAK